MNNRVGFIAAVAISLFVFTSAFAAGDAKNAELYEKIKGAVWEKVTADANKYRWEVTSTIIQMVKEAYPERDNQLKALDELSQISRKKVEDNTGKKDGASYLWLNTMFIKAKQTLIEIPVLSEGNKKSAELYDRIMGSVWGKVTDGLAKEDGAQAKMLEISNTIVNMVRETQADKNAQMKCAIDLIKINRQKLSDNKGSKDYQRYATLHAIMIKAAQIIRQR